MEIWKTIEGFDGIYEVSSLGNIKSFKYGKERILKGGVFNNRYKIVILRKNNKSKTYAIHKLVANAFLKTKSDRKKNLVVDHINNIKTDNRAVNLRIISHSLNVSKDRKNKTSEYLGVSKHNSTDGWVAQIRMNGKVKYIGIFVNEYDAHLAYENFVSITK